MTHIGLSRFVHDEDNIIQESVVQWREVMKLPCGVKVQGRFPRKIDQEEEGKDMIKKKEEPPPPQTFDNILFRKVRESYYNANDCNKQKQEVRT